MGIHKNYLELTTKERDFVDRIISLAFKESYEAAIYLAGDDRAEQAAEALATWVLESDK